MKTQFTLHRMLSITVLATVVTFVAVGGLLLHAATKKRSFDGKLSFKVCKKLPNGQWQELEKGEDRISFEGNLIDAATSKQFATNHVWSGTSSKGNRFTATTQGNIKLNADLVSGRFDLTSVPIRLNLNGKQHPVEFTFTTESINAPNGESLSGKRVRIVNKQGDIAVVGVSKPVVINHEEQFAGNKKLVDQKKVVEEFIFIARAEGKIAAK
ncbi:MAG TPA: hypothetical protein VFZ34_28620 [Blastocatellia bacterium]|nr:hypothetical protein [Blastocatellia bacterium]